MTELIERVYAPGDDCGGCGDPLEPGDLAVWVDGNGRVHDCCQDELGSESIWENQMRQFELPEPTEAGARVLVRYLSLIHI